MLSHSKLCRILKAISNSIQPVKKLIKYGYPYALPSAATLLNLSTCSKLTLIIWFLCVCLWGEQSRRGRVGYWCDSVIVNTVIIKSR